MGKRKGFTLIELLVVIAIIALLMSILMPALSRVKKQAQAVRCQAHLKQWGLIFVMYGNDNNNKIMTNGRDGHWMILTRPYLNTMIQNGRADDYELYFCPLAKKPLPQGETAVSLYSYDYEVEGITFTASYGFNAWLYEPPKPDAYQDRPIDRMWRTIDVKNASNVPLLTAAFHGGGCPESTDQPPQYDGAPWASGHNNEMVRFCLNRHGGFVNSLFTDGSIRKIGLKELWTLKWNRQYVVTGPWTRAGGVVPSDWPEWLRKYKDY
jgi:prepilin-type N-terminal cleavage/methylation domain-containing protein/prepilin-type processing-associated H-X9-DG protein